MIIKYLIIMKIKFIISSLIVIATLAFCGFKTFELDDRLCKSNEEIVFSFRLITNGKTISLCKDKNDKYLVYRFGTKENVELTFPKVLDKASWQNFKYYSIHRGGGKGNGGMGDIYLNFKNENAEYTVYHFWRDENRSNEIGIEVKVGNKKLKLKGNINSQEGALQELDSMSDLISNTAEE
ncbi:MAG: hypothetical protein C0459_07215 [Chitinophaga sp.]|nr:hypothetical protein [Chitinophaga sp.]